MEEETSRILIFDSVCAPDHAGQCMEGHALVERNGKWYYAVNYRSSCGMEKHGYHTYELPDGIFKGMTAEKLGPALFAAQGGEVKTNGDAFAMYSMSEHLTKGMYFEQIAALFEPPTSGPEA